MTETSFAARPRIVLLADDPSDSDEFIGKAHENVARAIAQLIDTESGGKVIGLEGSWGSGKSTIVRLLCNQLRKSGRPDAAIASEIHPVIFDAWAHQGDPLRRAFLETLIKELEGANWLSKEVAAKFRGKLSGRASTATSTTTPKLSWEGRFAAAAAALLPLGIVLFTNSFSRYHLVALFVGFFFLIAPFVVVGVFLGLKVIGVRRGGREEPEGTRLRRLADLDPFGFFATEQTRVTETTESVERVEPTSVEFERLFSDVLENALDGDRRLLIVLDNLDRVAESDARGVLATMQTFTGVRSLATTPSAARIWTLIPYDPSGLDRLWDLASPDEARSDEDEPASDDRTPATWPTTAAAFVEKIFQARFETPPLILSDWRSYLSRLLREAIPDVSEDDIGSVRSLRAQYTGAVPDRLVARDAPTPRQLKQFVNQMALISGQRSDIQLSHIAYYVMLQRDRLNVAALLRNGMLPHERLAHVFDDTIKGDLAALYFGTAQELGQQLLLGGELDQAFANAQAGTVRELMNREGSIDALETLSLEDRMANGGVAFTRMVATLDEANLLDRDDVMQWSKRQLQPRARRNPEWVLSGRDTGIGAAIMFDALSVGDDGALTGILSRVESDAGEVDSEGRLQLEGAAALAVGLASRGRVDGKISIQIRIPPDRLVNSLALFHGLTEDEPRARALLDPSTTAKEVAGLLVQGATSEAFGTVTNALDVIAARPARVDFKLLATDLLAWLQENDPTSGAQLEAQLNIFEKCRRLGSISDVLITGADDGTLMHLVAFARSAAAYPLMATASMLHLVVRPSFPDPPAARSTAEGTKLLRDALADPESNAELTAAHFDWLVEHSTEALAVLVPIAQQQPDAKVWVEHQLNRLEASGALHVSPSEYIGHWIYLQQELDAAGFARLTGSLLEDDANRRAVLAGSDDPSLAIQLLSMIHEKTSYATEVMTWASEIVKTTGGAKWEAQLRDPDGGPAIELAMRLAETSNAPSDPMGLEDALHAHFETLARAEAVWQPEAATFNKLAGLLSAATRQVVADRMCNELGGYVDPIGSGVFKTYGDFLGGEATFRTHEKLPQVVERLVTHDDWESVAWVVSLADTHPDTLSPEQRESAIDYLTGKVTAKLEEAGEDPPTALRDLATRLGVE